MVAVIKTGHSINRILNYNEQKVKEGVAECIAAVNYPKDVSQLTLSNKLNRLLKQVALNENVTRNSVHISLNFDPSENFTHARLNEIAKVYMQKIGFGEQPYLVYQHHDAGHPHVHLVSVKVRADGSRIDTQNIGRNQSEKARKEIEIAYGLKRAADSKQRQVYELKPINVQKVQYGKSETKRAITNVLGAVLNTYKYTSLPELNAVLGQYNVLADRGCETSRVYKNKGLVYRIIDENGNKIGVPIKASDFYNKPTLKYLEAKFSQNETAGQMHKVRVKNAIDFSLLKNSNSSLQSLLKALEKEGIATVIRQNENGLIYGITYVDYQTKCVFNGSALGKPYSAKGIQERCYGKDVSRQNVPLHIAQDLSRLQPRDITTAAEVNVHHKEQKNNISSSEKDNVLDALIQPVQSFDYLPYQFKKKKKKKQKHL